VLLRETEEAEEVLVLTYTANLEFFERFALGEARALQAATTVVSDAAMVTADPSSVRGAGLRYLDARAACPGSTAFHPKLLVIAGSGRATIAIGSGNLTLAGWHGSDELWTVLQADAERGPTTVREVAAFLRALGDGRVRLSAEAQVPLQRVAELLEGLAAGDSGPTLVSTMDGPIIERLPAGPVDELIVYAPFHDPALAGLRALQARMEPGQLTVYVQPQTSVDGPELERWLATHGGELRWCSDERYRHGKLIEWVRDGQREALTGSPNLSRRALLHELPVKSSPDADGDETDDAHPATARTIANCELGLIGRLDGSLAPAPVAAPADGVARLRIAADPAERPRPATLLLGATLTVEAEVRLLLATELRTHARVQAHDPRDDWTSVPGAELSPGRREYRIAAVGLPAGRGVRLLGSDGASNEVFVTDPGRARRRPVRRIGPETGTPIEMVLEGKLSLLYEIAELMRPELLRLGALEPKPAPRPSRQGTESDSAGEQEEEPARARPAPGKTLSDYLAACAAVLDEPTVEWALVLPSLPGLGGQELEGKRGVLTSETDDEAADAGAEDSEAPPRDLAEAVRKATSTRRGQFRRFCEGALERGAAWPNLMRAQTARLVLNAVAADLWPLENERGRRLSELVGVLAAPGDDPTDEERTALASYAAVTLALLRDDVTRLSVNDPQTLRFEAAASAGRGLVDDLDPVQLDTLAAELGDAFRAPPSGELIFELATQIQRPKRGISAAIALLREEDGISAIEQNGALVISDPLPAVPERDVVRAIGLVEGPGPVIVRGRTSRGVEIVCIWRAPLLLISRRTAAGPGGRLYRLSEGWTPRVIAAGWQVALDVRENLPEPVEVWFPGRTPSAEAVGLLELAGGAAALLDRSPAA